VRMGISNVLCVCVLLVCVLSVVNVVFGELSVDGGGSCTESNGTVYECPKYNYTRYGEGPDSYELREYSLDTWAISSSNGTTMPAPPQPTEALTALYPPLDAYFHGANADKLNITRAVAPVSIIWREQDPGVIWYRAIFFLPTLKQYPPPASTNPNVTVGGGQGHLRVFSRNFSSDHVPSDQEIIDFADRFRKQLENDQRRILDVNIMNYYDAIDAKGNWTKEIWFEDIGTEQDYLQRPIKLQTEKALKHRHK